MDSGYYFSMDIPGELPGLNEYINASKRHRGRNNAGNIMKQQCQAYIAGFIPKEFMGMMIDTPCTIMFTFYEKNMKRDPDNISATAHKFILDTLVQCRVLKNDGMKIVTAMLDDWIVDRENPRINVYLKANAKDGG